MDNFITACKEGNFELVKNLIKDFDLNVNKKIMLEILVFIMLV